MEAKKQKPQKDELKLFAGRLQKAMDAAKLTADEISERQKKDKKRHGEGDTGLTQVELANRLKIAQGMIADYIGAKVAPTAQNLAALAKALGVSADYLIGLSDEPTPDSNVQDIAKKYGLSGAALETLAGINSDYDYTWQDKWGKKTEAEKEDIEKTIRRNARRVIDSVNLLLSDIDIAYLFFDTIADIIVVQSREEKGFLITEVDEEYAEEPERYHQGRVIKFSLAASLCDILAQAVALNTPPETPKRGGKNATSKKEEG
jgi:transcriptional regulator with XRE-family HTH domain